jgi:hypothetical protein
MDNVQNYDSFINIPPQTYILFPYAFPYTALSNIHHSPLSTLLTLFLLFITLYFVLLPV